MRSSWHQIHIIEKSLMKNTNVDSFQLIGLGALLYAVSKKVKPRT